MEDNTTAGSRKRPAHNQEVVDLLSSSDEDKDNNKNVNDSDIEAVASTKPKAGTSIRHPRAWKISKAGEAAQTRLNNANKPFAEVWFRERLEKLETKFGVNKPPIFRVKEDNESLTDWYMRRLEFLENGYGDNRTRNYERMVATHRGEIYVETPYGTASERLELLELYYEIIPEEVARSEAIKRRHSI